MAAKITPQRMAEFGILHCASCDLEWWTWATESIASRRAEGSPRYEAYQLFLGRFLELDTGNPCGYAIHDLGLAEKWLLLVTIDEFQDQEIITHETFEEWRKVWAMAEEAYAMGYAYMADFHGTLDCSRLGDAWSCFRAALS